MYEVLKKRWEKKFVRKDQLKRYVAVGKLTMEEYEEITKEKYEG